MSRHQSIVPEHTLAPRISKRDDARQDEEQHAGQEERGVAGAGAEAWEGDGPRIEENDFDVEQQERHGDDVEADIEAAFGGADGVDAGFVRAALDLALAAGAQQQRADDVGGCENDGHEQQNAHGCIVAEGVHGQGVCQCHVHGRLPGSNSKAT